MTDLNKHLLSIHCRQHFYPEWLPASVYMLLIIAILLFPETGRCTPVEPETLVTLQLGDGTGEIPFIDMPQDKGTNVAAYALSSSGKIYLAENSRKKIMIFNLKEKYTLQKEIILSDIISDIKDMCLLPDSESVALLARESEEIIILDETGKVIGRQKIDPAINTPCRLTCSRTGQFTVLGLNGIEIFDTSLKRATILTGKGFFPYMRGDSMLAGSGESMETGQDIILLDPYGFRSARPYFTDSAPVEILCTTIAGIDIRDNFYVLSSRTRATTGPSGNKNARSSSEISPSNTDGTIVRIMKRISPEGKLISEVELPDIPWIPDMASERFAITPSGDIITARIDLSSKKYELVRIKF